MVPRQKPILSQIESLIEDIARGPSAPDVEDRLHRGGVTVNGRLVDCFVRISQTLALDQTSCRQLAIVMRALLESPYPTGALINFLRYIETVGVTGTFLSTLAEGKPIRDIVATGFG